MSAPITVEQWAALRRESTEVLPALANSIGLPKVLLEYQSKAVGLLDSSAIRVLFIEKSRRIGLTWGLASFAGLKASRSKRAGGMDVMYISYSHDMTREFIDAVAMWAKAFAMAAFEMEEYLFEDTDASDPTHTRQIKAFRIRFASGFEVMGLSSAPRSLRGKQGVVIIDEAAFVDNLKELLKSALAFLMWGGQVVVCSTHNGTENEFNVQIQDILGARSKYAHMRIDFDAALQQGLYQRICLVQGKDWTPEGEAAWRQEIIDFYGDGADEELFCIPSMGSGAWLTAPLIEARMTSDAPVLRLELPANFLHLSELARRTLLAPFMEELHAALKTLNPKHPHAFGFDFARVADLSVGDLLEIDDVMNRREALSVEMRGVPGDEQKQIVKEILQAAPFLVGAAFDATGMGWTVAEDMGRIFGLKSKDNETGLIEAVKFTQDWYRINMPPLKVAYEDGAISISKDQPHLSDLRSVKVIRGIPMVPQLREGETGKKRHGDYAIAQALAHYASRIQWTEYSYQAASMAKSRFEEPSSGSDRMYDRADQQARHDDGFRMASMRRSKGIY